MSQQRPSFATPSQHSLVCKVSCFSLLLSSDHHHVQALNSFLEDPPRPIEPDPSNGGISLAASSSPGLTDFGDLQPNGNIHRSSNVNDAFMRNPRQQQNPLAHWYTSHGPWDPVHGRNSNVFRTGNNSRPSVPSFSGYRNYASLSECETTAPGHLPSDSGYGGSLPRQSVVEASLYGDCDQFGDAGSVSSHLANVHFDRSLLPPSEAWGQQASTQNLLSLNGDANRLVCPFCKVKVKTKSELKKHNQKHTKPHYCQVSDCPRTEGFSTPNDVERHMRSCHPGIGAKGKYYKCTVAGCRSKEKQWPRADNFRQHLKRVHQIQNVDDDIEKYVCGPQPPPGHDLAGLASVGNGLIPLDMDHNGMNPDSWSLNMQSLHREVPRDSCGLNDYMDQQMDFQQDAVAQQHLEITSCAGDHVPDQPPMQLSPMALDTGAPLAPSPSEGISCQSHALQDLTVSSTAAQEANYDETSFLNKASMSHAESEQSDQSVVQHGLEPPEFAPSEEGFCEESSNFEQSASRDLEESPDADEEHDPPPPQMANILDDDDSFSITFTTPVSMPSGPSGDGDSMHVSPDDAQAAEMSLDFSDVLKNQTKAFDLIKALKEQGLLAGILEQLHYQPSREEEPTATVATPSRHDVSTDKHACAEPGCDKFFRRQCELRKHIKRHVKPYGCTFPPCDKRFGSKNDWKRHENSQHCHVELWKCNEDSGSGVGESCNQPFNRREHFRAHLTKDHGITDPKAVEHKLEDCLDGRNYELRFWCGFCKKMVQVREKGQKVWLRRVNHIDDHFSGQMDISEWKTPESGLQEVDVVLMAASDSDHVGLQNSASAHSAGAECSERPPKRGADGGVRHSRPSKKARTSTLWYCCGCDCQQLEAFSTTCLTPSCREHERCNDCSSDTIPLNSGENDL
ncbi:unnamed protein product [Discula destructiva]